MIGLISWPPTKELEMRLRSTFQPLFSFNLRRVMVNDETTALTLWFVPGDWRSSSCWLRKNFIVKYCWSFVSGGGSNPMISFFQGLGSNCPRFDRTAGSWSDSPVESCISRLLPHTIVLAFVQFYRCWLYYQIPNFQVIASSLVGAHDGFTPYNSCWKWWT